MLQRQLTRRTTTPTSSKKPDFVGAGAPSFEKDYSARSMPMLARQLIVHSSQRHFVVRRDVRQVNELASPHNLTLIPPVR